MREEGEARRALWLVSLSVLLSSSVWFSGTAVAPYLQKAWSQSPLHIAWLSISVQIGFIAGTLLYAVFNLADLLKTRKLFFISSVLAGFANAGFALLIPRPGTALLFRFFTGIFLAGVYPVGMKIVAQWYRRGLGWGLGVMVGALTLGSAVPFGLVAAGTSFDGRILVLAASALAAAGGLLVIGAVRDGPFLRETPPFDLVAAVKVFRIRSFRLQAVGYFGHMWELYAFWSLVPEWLRAGFARYPGIEAGGIALTAFAVIGIGAGGCLIGGALSRKYGERKVALISVAASGACCALSGWIFALPAAGLIGLVLIWGILVIADSPQYSALAVRYCPPRYTGTALTMQNGVGFAVTVISIQWTAWLAHTLGWRWIFVFLVFGPAAAAAALHRLKGEIDV